MSTMDDVINQYVKNHSKQDLVNECKSKQLSTYGTKQDLAKRILNVDNSTNHTKRNANTAPIMTTAIKKNKIDSSPSSSPVYIYKNQYNHYCHDESQLVFDPISKRVIGVQLEDGNIKSLTREHIERCQTYKFKYNLPETMEVYEILENSEAPEPSSALSDSEMHDVWEDEEEIYEMEDEF